MDLNKLLGQWDHSITYMCRTYSFNNNIFVMFFSRLGSGPELC